MNVATAPAPAINLARRRDLFSSQIVLTALKQSFVMLRPDVQWTNPVMFVVEIGAVLTLLYVIQMALGFSSSAAASIGYFIALDVWRRAVPITPMDRTGAFVDCFPVHPAFPVVPAGRHPYLHFRGLLRLYSRYGPLDRSTAQGGLCHEAPAQPVTRPDRSSATRSIDNSLGGIFLHW